MTAYEDLLVNNSPEAQDLALKLRGLVLRLLPEAREKTWSGWGVADYYMEEPIGRGFMTIGPQNKHVNLYFMHGVDLPDPASLLTGTGKRMRHVKIKGVEDLENEALKTLIKVAADFR